VTRFGTRRATSSPIAAPVEKPASANGPGVTRSIAASSQSE
jgi:hypothetical protein